MNTTINTSDLGELANQSCSMVQALDFPEFANFEQSRLGFIGLLDQMDNRYSNNELLFNARVTVSCRPVRKLDLYTLTRDIVRMARGVESAQVARYDDQLPLPTIAPSQPATHNIQPMLAS